METYPCKAPATRRAPLPLCGEPIPEERAARALARGKTPSYCSDHCRNVANDVTRFTRFAKNQERP
jgi:hypothetical protein